MEPRDFCYWLQGLLEVSKVTELDEEQVQMIKDHLQLVFDKRTPERVREPDTGCTIGPVAPWPQIHPNPPINPGPFPSHNPPLYDMEIICNTDVDPSITPQCQSDVVTSVNFGDVPPASC